MALRGFINTALRISTVIRNMSWRMRAVRRGEIELSLANDDAFSW